MVFQARSRSTGTRRVLPRRLKRWWRKRMSLRCTMTKVNPSLTTSAVMPRPRLRGWYWLHCIISHLNPSSCIPFWTSFTVRYCSVTAAYSTVEEAVCTDTGRWSQKPFSSWAFQVDWYCYIEPAVIDETVIILKLEIWLLKEFVDINNILHFPSSVGPSVCLQPFIVNMMCFAFLYALGFSDTGSLNSHDLPSNGGKPVSQYLSILHTNMYSI